LLIGAHVGVSKGYAASLEYARSVGAECVQVFAKSPRQWHARALDVDAATAFREAKLPNGIRAVVTHTAYLINLGSLDESLLDKSVRALADELRRAALLGADGVVTHIGTTGGTGTEATATRVAAAIVAAFGEREVPLPRLLLENTAGAGSTFGTSPEEIGAVLDRLPDDLRPHVGTCIDSCHAHAAGFDMSSAVGWAELLDRIDTSCGPHAVGAVHANDCMFACGSNKDRHAWIGDGTIGYEGFAAMLCEPRLLDVPAFLEMPGEVPLKDEENITRLKRLRDGCAERA